LLLSRSLKPAVLAVCLLAAGCDRHSEGAAQPGASGTPGADAAQTGPSDGPARGVDRSHKGSESPALTVADPSGRKLALADLRGKPVLINLWATWCAPCVAELPTLQALAGKGTVRVLAISQDSGDPAAVAKFLADRKLDRLEPWIDPDSDLSFHYNTGILPTTVLYDSSGREVWRYAGEHDWSGPEAAALIAEAR